jgi:multidrug efflux system outer membrane protein
MSLLAACTLEPRYDRPRSPVPDLFPVAAAAPGAAQEASDHPQLDLDWKQFFSDPKLRQLIAVALTNNRDLRLAVLKVDRARAQYGIARARLLPTIDAGGTYTRQNLPPALTFGITSTSGEYYQALVGLAPYEIDLFGRVRSATHAALEKYFATEEAGRAARLTLIGEVANTYLTLSADESHASETESSLAKATQSLKLQRERYQRGSASETELVSARMTVEQLEAQSASIEADLAHDRDALALLVGMALPDNWLTVGPGSDALPEIPSGLTSALLLRRPDVRGAEHDLRSANANIGVARAAFFPSITLTGTAGSASASLANLFSPGTAEWIFTPAITLPIFHGGENLATERVAKVDREIALAQYEKTIQKAFRDVSDALSDASALKRKRAAQQLLADDAWRASDLAQRRYERGAISYFELLDAERRTDMAREDLQQTQVSEQINRVAVFLALGSGW